MSSSGVSVPQRELYIDGQWCRSFNGKYIDVITPSTEAVIGRIPAASAEDVNAAVMAAKKAVKKGLWTKSTGKYRADILRSIATKVREKKEYLAQLETMDMGKPIEEAEWDMDDVAGCFEYYANVAEELDLRQNAPVHIGMSEFVVKVRYEPLGVVALITPWNYPLLMAAWKVAPALAAGCCVVLKPSELASLTPLELAAICHQAGLPAGVINVVTGYGADAGAPLSAHPDCAKVAFTGSVATGRLVNLAAAANLRPTTMELGGKSALVVFEDADIEKAVEWTMFGCFWTNGQICSATSRLLVHRSIAEQFLKHLKARAESILVTDPLDRKCRLGPIVSQGQYKKILSYIQAGKDEGAVLLTGGSRPASQPKGYFILPTVFTNVKPHMRIWREEIFGPLLSVTTFNSEEEAVRLANDTEFGLGGAVISADPDRCKRVSEALEAGVVWVNCSQPCFCEAPWGGVKNSGFGRELGKWGLDAYLSVKQLTSYVSPDTWSWYNPPTVSKL